MFLLLKSRPILRSAVIALQFKPSKHSWVVISIVGFLGPGCEGLSKHNIRNPAVKVASMFLRVGPHHSKRKKVELCFVPLDDFLQEFLMS